MRRPTLALLALLLPALSGAAQSISVRPVPLAVPRVQASALGASAVLLQPRLSLSVIPTLQTLQALQSASPMVAPVPVLAAPAVMPVQVQPTAMAQVAALTTEISGLSQVQAAPAQQSAALARVFDNAPGDSAGAVSVDYAGVPNQSLRGADRARIESLRSFRKALKAISHGAPLTQAAADALIRQARELGVPLRIHPSDLQAQDNHWVRGPHIHVGDFHIPVEAGYVPTLVPGFANPN
jgi:hypothetical protein